MDSNYLISAAADPRPAPNLDQFDVDWMNNLFSFDAASVNSSCYVSQSESGYSVGGWPDLPYELDGNTTHPSYFSGQHVGAAENLEIMSIESVLQPHTLSFESQSLNASTLPIGNDTNEHTLPHVTSSIALEASYDGFLTENEISQITSAKDCDHDMLYTSQVGEWSFDSSNLPLNNQQQLNWQHVEMTTSISHDTSVQQSSLSDTGFMNISQDGPYLTVGPKTKRRNRRGPKFRRALISIGTKLKLEAFFQKNPYPSKDDISVLANKHSLPYSAVKNWFTNIRSRRDPTTYLGMCP